MGLSVGKRSDCKELTILQRTIEKIFGWENIQTLSPEQEQQGESLDFHLVGGLKDENNKKVDYPVVLKVAKKDLVDLEGRKAQWSDFVAARAPDGTLLIVSDLHNFDPMDKISFLTDDLMTGLKSGYAKEAIDIHLTSIKQDVIEDWHENGDYLEKMVEIDEDDIDSIPQANFL